MKRFRFQLEPVLDFKTQALDSLMVELNTIQARVMAQEKKLNEAIRTLADYDAECTEKKTLGMTIVEAMQCEACQRVLEQRVRREREELARLQREAEAKRSEVVEARKETHSLEKLKELRRSEYDTAVAKEEEKILDDLTASRRVADAAS